MTTITTRLSTFALVLALTSMPGYGADAPADATPEVPPDEGAAATSESAQLGRTLLLDMTRFLAGLDRFTVTVRGGYDVVQDDGRKIEFLEVRDVALARPDRLRVDEKRADGRDSYVLFDGSAVVVFDGADAVYATAPQPGPIDDSILYFIRDLGMRLPLAPLLSTKFPDELGSRLEFADHVETNYVFDEPVHHVVGSTAVVDFQVWITDGDQPLPRRIVLTYRGEAGQPQYWADFVDWNMRPRLEKSLFEFKPPKDARAIVFAVQMVPPGPAPEAAASMPAGETP